ncbi:hypothetical protein [Synechococcus sp. UW105]|uniref:hypothetical protein n=1 Tax=Synechococcus sp. UW105 TaxID=337067 RepID=UPI000E0F80CA|nr:hypothetical protein [Synechococcus sp. UW105]
MKYPFGVKLPPLRSGERRYLLGLGATLTLIAGGYFSYQLWLSYSPDWNRAIAWIGGAQDLGTTKLQQPILRQASFPKIAAQQRGMAAAADQAVKGLQIETLPLAGESLEIHFAGIDLPSNSSITNYLLLNIKQELLKAKANYVKIVYPKATYRLAETATTDGVPSELDTVLMTVRDQELFANTKNNAADTNQLIIRIREAGVDTEDRSIYSQDFYSRVAFSSCLAIFVVGAGGFVLVNRRWPGHGRRTAALATLLAIAAGWNLVMWLFVTLRPNQKRFNVVSRVDLTAFIRLADENHDRSGQGRHEVLLGVDRFNKPSVLGRPTVLSPMEGGFVPLIPPTPIP